MTVEPATVPSDRCADVYRWRYREARQAGMTIIEASLFADSQADLAQLRKLVAAGCAPELILAIVL